MSRHLPLLLLLWLAFGLRLYHLDAQSIWWDEGHSIFVASHPFAEIPTLPAMDVHPPAYFVLLRLWMSVAGGSEFALRYLSVCFSLLTVALLWRFAAAIMHHSPFIPGLLAALSPMYVAYAQEVRSYAMLTFLAAASAFWLWQIIFRGPTRRRLLFYITLTAAGLYTHYFTLFLLLFENVAWAWRHKRRLVIWLGVQAGVLLLFAPQLRLALRQVSDYANPNLSPPSLGYFLSHSWQAYTMGLTIAPDLGWWGMIAIAGVLAVALIAPHPRPLSLWERGVGFLPPLSLWERGLGGEGLPGDRREGGWGVRTYGESLLFLAGWLVIPLAAYFVTLQRRPSFEPRYLILVTPALLLLLGLCLRRWAVLAVIPIAFFGVGLHSYYTDETYFKDDSAGVAAWLAAETTPNDVVYVDVPHPFQYYVARGRIPAPTRYLFVDIHTAAETLTREAAGRDRLYWVTWRGSDTDPRGVIPFLAEKFGQELGRRDFRGYRVRWYSLPADGAFSLPTTLPPVEATFGETLRLDGAAYGGEPPGGTTIMAGQSAWATLHFTLLQETEVNYKVSLRLRSEAGQMAGQVDQDLLNDRHFRTAAWPLADPALNQAINVYTLPSLAADAPPGPYQLEVVVYHAEPPYPAEGVTGGSSPDGVAAVIGRLTALPGE
jgi:hypothetical protein